VLQAVTRYSQKEEERTSSLVSALTRLDASLPDPEWNEVGWRLWERLAPHCRTLLDYLREHALEPKATRMMNQLALWFSNRAEYTEAPPLYQRALAIREKVLGPEHPDVAESLNDLAVLYRAQGQYAKAEPLYQRALAIWEKALSPEHTDLAWSLNNLAGLYTDKGQYAEAQPLYQRALAIREKVLGPEHPNVATSLNDLAALYDDQGRYAEAQPLYQRALAIREKVLKPEYPNVNVATCLENYALEKEPVTIKNLSPHLEHTAADEPQLRH
jgi:tetratricopeptide (TPR) repeat protein